MRDRPTPEELLKGARVALDRDIAPLLEGEARFAAILVSRAIGVAARAFAAGSAPARAEVRALQRLLGQAPTGPQEADAFAAELTELNRELAQRIRRGGFDDGDAYAQLLDHLERVTRDKLAESNPKYFDASRPASSTGSAAASTSR